MGRISAFSRARISVGVEEKWFHVYRYPSSVQRCAHPKQIVFVVGGVGVGCSVSDMILHIPEHMSLEAIERIIGQKRRVTSLTHATSRTKHPRHFWSREIKLGRRWPCALH